MWKTVARLLAFSAVAVPLVPLPLAATTAARYPRECRLLSGHDSRALQCTFSTALLASGKAGVYVALPRGYGTAGHENSRYPVVYFLHGCCAGTDGPRAFMDASPIISLTQRDEMITVFPDAGPLGFFANWRNYGSAGTPLWEDLHLNKVLPWVDRNFRTKADRAHRAVIGVSMGGFGAVSYAARHPDLFATVITMSGIVDMVVPDSYAFLHELNAYVDATIPGAAPVDAFNRIWGDRTTEEIYWRAGNPVDLAGNLKNTRIGITYGGDCTQSVDPTECLVWRQNQNLVSALNGARIAHSDKVVSGSHTTSWLDRLRDFTLPFLRSSFVQADRGAGGLGSPSSFNFRTASGRFSMYGWSFRVVGSRAAEFLDLFGVSARGLTARGSGSWTVTSPSLYKRGASYCVAGRRVLADSLGRLSFGVSLGAAHSQDQYTVGAIAAEISAGSSYFRAARVTIGSC